MTVMRSAVAKTIDDLRERGGLNANRAESQALPGASAMHAQQMSDLLACQNG